MSQLFLQCRPKLCVAGPLQMALDEILLQAALNEGQACIRFYTWPQPTLTLGYFQNCSLVDENSRWQNLPWLRRHTGGAAILHDQELTYAIALPAKGAWHTEENWLHRFHRVLIEVLQKLEISTQAVADTEEKKLGDFLCFLHQTPGDLLLQNHKVVGSAQRRPHGALLQHGSILLRQCVHTPELPGIEDLARVNDIQKQALAKLDEQILQQLAREIPCEIQFREWTQEEFTRAQEIVEAKYGTEEWNRKR